MGLCSPKDNNILTIRSSVMNYLVNRPTYSSGCAREVTVFSIDSEVSLEFIHKL